MDGALSGTIHYTGLEPVIDNLGAVNRIFTFTGAAETITLDAGGTLDNQIDSTLGESIDFNQSQQLVDHQPGSRRGQRADTVNVEGLDAGFNADLTVNGGNDDTVTFQTAATGLTSGNLSINAGTINVNRPSRPTARSAWSPKRHHLRR